MSVDRCLELVAESGQRKPWSAVESWIGEPLERLGLHARTPHDRIVVAVGKEIADLIARATGALGELATDEPSRRAVDHAKEVLARGNAERRFPREELRALWGGHGAGPPSPVRTELDSWIGRHEALERRVKWLLDPRITRDQLANLDPLADSDQIWCSVRFEFRPEVLYALWGNAMERIAQVEAAATFFHGTGKAEGIPLKRTEDTVLFYAYLFNWGQDSYHGRKAIERMNVIHGRYFAHNDGLKYVLLNGGFTVLDGLPMIGHRPLSDKERLGYFHATVAMGKAMNIQELTHSWDEMYTWFHDLNRATAAPSPQKVRMWNGIEDGFDRDLKVPKVLSDFRKLAERASMDDTYLSALGFERPSAGKVAFVRGVMKTVARARAQLPTEPYIQSLQNYATYPEGGPVETIGEKERSARMPSACPFAASAAPKPNKGYPVNQRPLMDVSEAADIDLVTVTWEEVTKHRTADDLWLVWHGYVYDVSSFAANHPGGLKVLLGGVGREMSKAFEKAKHTELTKVFALNFRIAKIDDAEPPRRITRVSEGATQGSTSVTTS